MNVLAVMLGVLASQPEWAEVMFIVGAILAFVVAVIDRSLLAAALGFVALGLFLT